MDSRKWEIIITVLRLARTVENALTRHLTAFGVGFTDLRLLLMVSVLQGVSQKELATRMGVSQVVVSTRLDKLERTGMITRSQVGRRLVSVKLTASGKEMLNLLLLAIEQSAPGRALQPLSRTDTDTILEAIRSLVSALQSPGDPNSGTDAQTLPAEVRERLGLAGRDLEGVLQKENEQVRGAVEQLAEELDTLVRAYVLLRPGSDSGSLGLTNSDLGSGGDK